MMAAETPTIVFVHGAWADATGFDAEIRALQNRGYTAIGFGNPLRDLAGDSAYLAEFLRTLTDPIDPVAPCSTCGNSHPSGTVVCPWDRTKSGLGSHPSGDSGNQRPPRQVDQPLGR